MPKLINYGNMFVIEDPRKNGSFIAACPDIWGERPITKHFGHSDYTNPKLRAEAFVTKLLKEMYGSKRAAFIQSTPQWVKKMKFGCGVNISTTTISRKNKIEGIRTYPAVRLTYRKHILNGHKMTTKQVNRVFIFNNENRIEKEHEASIEAAKARAEVALSNLDERVFNLEFDLDFIRDSRTTQQQLAKH